MKFYALHMYNDGIICACRMYSLSDSSLLDHFHSSVSLGKPVIVVGAEFLQKVGDLSDTHPVQVNATYLVH